MKPAKVMIDTYSLHGALKHYNSACIKHAELSDFHKTETQRGDFTQVFDVISTEEEQKIKKKIFTII